MWLHSPYFSHVQISKSLSLFFYHIQHPTPFEVRNLKVTLEVFLFFIPFFQSVIKSCQKYNLNMTIFLPSYCCHHSSVHHYLLISMMVSCSDILGNLFLSRPLRAMDFWVWFMDLEECRAEWDWVIMGGHIPEWETIYEGRVQVGVVHFSGRLKSLWNALSQRWEIKSISRKWSFGFWA